MDHPYRDRRPDLSTIKKEKKSCQKVNVQLKRLKNGENI